MQVLLAFDEVVTAAMAITKTKDGIHAIDFPSLLKPAEKVTATLKATFKATVRV
jgi:hypothetical protein